VADLADAHVAALEATSPADARTGPVGGGPTEPVICNLGTSTGFSVRDVLEAAEAVVGAAIPYTVGPRRAGDPPVLVASNARAAAVLGWTPGRSTLAEMIGSAWAWRWAHPAGYGD
jgi:UDP-glucose 4-epimerase